MVKNEFHPALLEANVEYQESFDEKLVISKQFRIVGKL